jgi:multifunctional beta-oxidation protein
MSKRLGSYTHEYSERDLALYALGLGCGVQDLRYVYECHNDFAALPTFAVIPAHPVAMFVPLEGYIPRYDRVRGQAAWCTAWHRGALP